MECLETCSYIPTLCLVIDVITEDEDSEVIINLSSRKFVRDEEDDTPEQTVHVGFLSQH